jgi:hypothetical protein
MTPGVATLCYDTRPTLGRYRHNQVRWSSAASMVAVGSGATVGVEVTVGNVLLEVGSEVDPDADVVDPVSM